MTDKPELLNMTETAELLGVSRRTIWKWTNDGLLYRIPGTNRIARREIERFLEDASRPPPPEIRRRGPYRSTREARARGEYI